MRWTGFFRLYWEGRDPVKPWGVDRGIGHPVNEAAAVRFVNPGVLRTGIDPTADNVKEPGGWLEGVGTVICSGGVIIIQGA